MRVHLPEEDTEYTYEPPKAYRKQRRPKPSYFTRLTWVLFIFSLFILIGAVMLVMHFPVQTAIGGALTAAGSSILWKGFGS